MPTAFRDGAPDGDDRRRGELSSAISSAVVHLVADHTGRGPTKARTTISGELVVVLLHDSMTAGERSLVLAGKEDEVLQIRRAFQETMRQDLVAAVEGLTDRRVVAFMSANHIDPDAAAEVFLWTASARRLNRSYRARLRTGRWSA